MTQREPHILQPRALLIEHVGQSTQIVGPPVDPATESWPVSIRDIMDLMRDLKPPFKFDIARLMARVRSLPIDVDATATVGLPGIKVTARIDDAERRVARELVIRLADRRVLNAQECCDDCIEQALESLHEIRRLIVDKQVELAGHTNSPLYLLLELMGEGIRQFLTFEESIRRASPGQPDSSANDWYFAGLEALRAHIYRTMIQVAAIADVAIPTIADAMRYSASWNLDAYIVDESRSLEPGDGR